MKTDVVLETWLWTIGGVTSDLRGDIPRLLVVVVLVVVVVVVVAAAAAAIVAHYAGNREALFLF